MRQIVLDTETTGLEPAEGHRIIEIGCVEMINRRLTGKRFHCYINPERVIDDGAIEVHGITNEFLADKPKFAEVAEPFVAFVSDAELVIHNAPFDVGFLDYELQGLADQPYPKVEQLCGVLDTLLLARRMHPGQRNSLDALCKRYQIDNSHRELHGALLDAEILARVYLAMTGGQTAMMLGDAEQQSQANGGSQIRRLSEQRQALPVIAATAQEMAAHEEQLAALLKSSGQRLWS